MKILFIEDEQIKAKQIIEQLKSIIHNHEVLIEKSLMSGIRRIHNEQYDVILLDMSLPLYDLGGEIDEFNEFEAFAGIDLLEELSRVKYNGKVIVITAFDVIEDNQNKLNLSQLNDQMKRDYPDIYIGCIHYNSSSLEWRFELENILKEIDLK